MGNIRRYGAGRIPSSGSLMGHFIYDQPRDWRGRWVGSRGIHNDKAKGKKVLGPLGSSRAYGLYKHKNAHKRGVGLVGLKKNTVPYARLSTAGTTVGFNAGTILPGSRRRVVFGAYGRIEHEDMYARQKIASNVLISKSLAGTIANRLMGGGATGRRATQYMTRAQRAIIRQGPKGLTEVLAGKRMDVAGGRVQARFTSTRKYNPTVTVRRGRHKVSPNLSHKGSVSYARHIEVLNQRKDRKYKPRPARRKAAKKRVR
jgi:hypothetical protein